VPVVRGRVRSRAVRGGNSPARSCASFVPQAAQRLISQEPIPSSRGAAGVGLSSSVSGVAEAIQLCGESSQRNHASSVTGVSSRSSSAQARTPTPDVAARRCRLCVAIPGLLYTLIWSAEGMISKVMGLCPQTSPSTWSKRGCSELISTRRARYVSTWGWVMWVPS
jgi:hypothetical protein